MVAIFRVNDILSLHGIKFCLLSSLVNYVTMILGICQLHCDVIGYEQSDKCELGTLYTLKKKHHDVLIQWTRYMSGSRRLLMSEVLLSLVTSTLQPHIGLCTASFLFTAASSSITRYLYHQLMWYNSLWLWWWRVLRLSKCVSLSTTVLLRTTLTQMIMKKRYWKPQVGERE